MLVTIIRQVLFISTVSRSRTIGNKIACLYTMGLIYPELSYRLVGILQKVYNGLGGGYQEKYYQNAIKQELISNNINFLEQVRSEIYYKGHSIGKYYLDFIIEHKVVLEIKAVPFFARKDILQILGYLKNANLELGILANFHRKNLQIKRIIKGY